jgi:hypothetical protein
MPQSFQSFNIICIETILSSGDDQHDVLCSTVATVGHGTRLCAVCSKKCRFKEALKLEREVANSLSMLKSVILRGVAGHRKFSLLVTSIHLN